MKLNYLIVLCMLISSCNINDGSELEASYIHFERPTLTTLLEEGPNTHNIKELYVEMEGMNLGVWPIDRTVPFLPELDSTKVFVIPHIKRNGTQANSVQYPFYNSVEIDKRFVPGATDTMALNFTYLEPTLFSFVEDFESSHIFTKDEDDDEDSMLKLESEGANGYGAIRVDEDHPEVTISTFLEINDIPLNGRPVYLEMEYKNTIDFVIGIVGIISPTNEAKAPKIVLLPKQDWNKIYIDFTEDIVLSQLDRYRIFISVIRDEDASGVQEVLVDNIKLLHF